VYALLASGRVAEKGLSLACIGSYSIRSFDAKAHGIASYLSRGAKKASVPTFLGGTEAFFVPATERGNHVTMRHPWTVK
jgi:hypothetical protein